MRRSRPAWPLALAIVLVSAWSTAHAVSVRSWSASTQEEFAHGTLDGTSLDEQGRVRLAPQLETLWGPGQGVVWSVQPAGHHSAFVALSGPGRVLRVQAGAPPEIWFETEGESLVTSVIADGPDRVVFGLSPEGTVKRATRNGDAIEVEDLFSTEALFVWTLTLQTDGSLWIGTGVPGRLLRAEPGGEPELVFDSGDDPVRSSVALPDGGVVIGTGGRGRIIRVRPDGKAFVLYDAEETEIVSLATTSDGTVFAVATQSPKQPAPRARAATPGGSGQTVVVTASPDDDDPADPPADETPSPPPSAARPPQSFQSRPGGTLYRIDTDGTVRQLWQTDREMPFAVVAPDDDTLLIGTGDNGRVHTLDPDGRGARLLRIPSEQVSAMAADAEGHVVLGGTTDARVELLGPAPRAEGSYLSPAVDAGSIADWGRLLWEAGVPRGARLDVHVRSGNTAEPDDTWSDWFAAKSGGAEGTATTEVPAARWFQARFQFHSSGDDSPRLRMMEVSFQPRNRPPSISQLLVEPAGVAWLRGPNQSSFRAGPVVADDPVARRVAQSLVRGPRGGRSPGAIRRTYEAGARTFTWTAEDLDDDRLSYALAIRNEAEDDWFPMTRSLKEDFYSWDARAIPDGVYRVRLTVDDSMDNPNGTHRRAERVSDAFRVDNTPPTVGEHKLREEGGVRLVRFDALDPGGSIAAVEVALDGGPWTPLSPLDGVADSEREGYELKIDEHAPTGPLTLRIRVTDAAGNLGGALWRID